MTTLNFPHQDDNNWLMIEVGGQKKPQYPSPLEVKMLIEEAVRKAENRYRFDIEGKMYLAKELVKHIEHHDKLDASFERGRVDAFEEMLQTVTPNHQD